MEHVNTTIGGLKRESDSATCSAMTDDAEFAQIGARLEAIRKAFSDLSQKDWAQKHGFAVTRWNNWEKGFRRIPVDEAEVLADLYGLDLDFIYRGRRSGLSENASKVL